MKLIHLTDTHLVSPGEMLYGLNPQQRLKACIKDINAHHSDADLAVITGDLTHWGEASAYQALRNCLDHLNLPWRLILGNHDDRETFLRYFPNEPVDPNGFVQSVMDLDRARLIFLDTNQPGTHAGWYCEQRLAWLVQQLENAGDMPVFLFMHHPPFPVHLHPLDQIGLIQAEIFTDRLAPYRTRIRHLFFGHVHRPIAGNWDGVSFTTLRGTNHQCQLDFTAEDQLGGNHEPPAYAIAFIASDNVVIHTHDFLDASPSFDMGNVAMHATQ